MERTGILGGTFDPPHIGHLILGEYAAEALNLTRLLFVPAADPPHKVHEYKTPIIHRLKMLELALADNVRFSISQVDIDRAGPHYSVDTVRIIGRQFPQSELHFIMGGDSLRDLPMWHRPQEFIRLCKLAVMRRPDDGLVAAMNEEVLPGLADRVYTLDAPLIDVSSTHITDRIQQGQSVRYLVPDPVLEYIHEHHLYEQAMT
jgi:nicotinate-nucleotide adenylyltransferase